MKDWQKGFANLSQKLVEKKKKKNKKDCCKIVAVYASVITLKPMLQINLTRRADDNSRGQSETKKQA